MDKILITQGTTPFAQRVSKLLVPTYNILYGSSEAFPDLLIKNGYRKIPRGGSPTFAHEVLKLCLDENYLFVLPLGKEELAGLHQSRILFGEYGISVLIPKNLEDAMIIEKPELGLPLQIFSDGVDLVSGAKLENQNFSGVGISSDDQDAVVLCLT